MPQNNQEHLTSTQLLDRLQSGQPLTLQQQIALTMRLSLPAMLAQVTSIAMQYIDASMVGQLGAHGSAAIGLVSTSTWLFGGLCVAAATGFTVLVAQQVGAGRQAEARSTMKQGLAVAFGYSLVLTLVAVLISGWLPIWLGGEAAICADASAYFLIYMLSLPAMQLSSLAGGMLQSSGNMRTPSMLNVLACILDVVLNAVLIFPTRTIMLGSFAFTVPGAGMGVAGAALGTALAEVIIVVPMLVALLGYSPILHLREGEPLRFSGPTLKKALKIGLPVAFERAVMSSAQVMSTRIISPLGSIAIAANSFAVTAESICYMPGYGIGAAATTLIGQSIGAKRKDLTRRLAWISTAMGMAIMAVAGVLMYVAAPAMIGLLTPDPEIRALGIAVLRIEAFAEPLFGASIVASGALRGAGDTMVSSALNFISMWALRIPLAALLAPTLGLRGAWIAMCAELCVRGLLFLARLKGRRWQQAMERHTTA